MTTTAASSEQLDESIDKNRQAIKDQSAAGLILQAHCLSVEAQSSVSFQGFDALKDFKGRANNALTEASSHAKSYLNTIQPRIITTITSIEEYFLLQNAVADTLVSLPAREDAKSAIRVLQERVRDYQRQSDDIRHSLNTLRTQFSADQAAFGALTNELNSVLQGDNGVLADINAQLASIDGKIAGAAVGVALGGLAVIAGGIMFVVGAFTSVVTGGAAVALCVAGGAVLATGVGVAAGSAVALGGLLNMKSDLISRQASLSAEVTLVNGMMNGFGVLASSAGSAQEGAQSMANAWGFMNDHLESLYGNLDKGNTDNAMLRRIFLTAADKSVTPILRDVEIIKRQMTLPTRNQNTSARVGDLVLQQAQIQQAALLRRAA